MALTDKACKNAQPREKPYKMADSAGLYLHVMPNGAKYWRLKYRYLGKEKLLALGVYGQMSLAEARDARDKAQKLVKAGKDPAQIKRLEKLQRAQDAENSFEAVAREWHGKRLDTWSKNYGVEVLHRMKTERYSEYTNQQLSNGYYLSIGGFYKIDNDSYVFSKKSILDRGNL